MKETTVVAIKINVEKVLSELTPIDLMEYLITRHRYTDERAITTLFNFTFDQLKRSGTFIPGVSLSPGGGGTLNSSPGPSTSGGGVGPGVGPNDPLFGTTGPGESGSASSHSPANGDSGKNSSPAQPPSSPSPLGSTSAGHSPGGDVFGNLPPLTKEAVQSALEESGGGAVGGGNGSGSFQGGLPPSSEKPRCPHCNAEILDRTFEFCLDCGKPLREGAGVMREEEEDYVPEATIKIEEKRLLCPVCGADVHAELEYCTSCGSYLGESVYDEVNKEFGIESLRPIEGSYEKEEGGEDEEEADGRGDMEEESGKEKGKYEESGGEEDDIKGEEEKTHSPPKPVIPTRPRVSDTGRPTIPTRPKPMKEEETRAGSRPSSSPSSPSKGKVVKKRVVKDG